MTFINLCIIYHTKITEKVEDENYEQTPCGCDEAVKVTINNTIN